MIVGALVITTFVVMVAVILKGNQAIVYVFDEFNNVYKKRARIKDSQLTFKYNGHSKGGVSIENNKYKQGKKNIFLFREVSGTLLPITDSKIAEKKMSLDFSTAQEKRFETEALTNISKKIDNTWTAFLKPIVGSFIIVMGAAIVSIVMIQNALDVEPVPEPQVEMFMNTTYAINDLVESNQQIVENMGNSNDENNEEDDNIAR